MNHPNWNKYRRKAFLCLWLATVVAATTIQGQMSLKVETVNKPDNTARNRYYVGNKAPLQQQYFIKLPVTAIRLAAG
ncbi:hypothetical protein [Paraflavitalea speifideaquila]|uniref:hypothetical protein n=1 Tax=Paraflavitalea speifideaquila TaxID=3076558 RepID=UPI0028E98B9D|nr:hypothetical protein [Paraflavitalea speifideiaquila]